MLYRAIKRFELDLSSWPWPPDRGGDDWADYWETRFEDALFRTGLGIRKLIEASKLSIEAQKVPIEVVEFPLRAKRYPDRMNRHRVEEFYDTEAGATKRIPIIALCHAIIHSYVLLPRFVGSGITGLKVEDFYLASDRGRKKSVYLVTWHSLADELINHVMVDDVRDMRIFRTGEGEELIIPLSGCRPTNAVEGWEIRLYMDLAEGNPRAVERFMQSWEQRVQSLRAKPPTAQEPGHTPTSENSKSELAD